MKKNTIDLEKAQRWANRWKKKEGHYNKHHKLNAFLIPKVDVIEVLGEGIDAVRAYIGVDDDGVEKLMIVGTKLDKETGIYVDMITVASSSDTSLEGDIYDFSQPCPDTCDPKSPLM